MHRVPENPILTPADVPPSGEGLRVRGVFNPAATVRQVPGEPEEVLLLLRVAEDVPADDDHVGVPVVAFDDAGVARIEPLVVRLDDPDVQLRDTRGVRYRGTEYLTTLSHLRLARSRDGVNFTVDREPFLLPQHPSERFGVEDARITRLADRENRYFINFTIVSPDNWATALVSTDDLAPREGACQLERHGTIFHPSNKDVSIFPERIGGQYYALHRPNNEGFGKASIWLARSPDLEHWGHHECLLRPRTEPEAAALSEAVKIGGGPPCLKTPRGWLQLYHGKGENQRYTLHLALLALDDPSRVLARTVRPIFEPQEEYETTGFFGGVVFATGLVEFGDRVLVYYGASDDKTCAAATSIDELLTLLDQAS